MFFSHPAKSKDESYSDKWLNNKKKKMFRFVFFKKICGFWNTLCDTNSCYDILRSPLNVVLCLGWDFQQKQAQFFFEGFLSEYDAIWSSSVGGYLDKYPHHFLCTVSFVILFKESLNNFHKCWKVSQNNHNILL